MQTDKKNANLDASIIIASYNRYNDLKECLDRLYSLDLPDTEIMVVDDASTDGTSDLIESQYPDVCLIVNEQNMGPAVSRNRGSREARGRLLIFLDSDAVPEKDWYENLCKNDDGQTLLIGCIKDYEGERIQGGPRRITYIGKSVRCAEDMANTGASCNMAIPNNFFTELGGFDEELSEYFHFEDSDLCVRANKVGVPAKYVSDAVVRHKGDEFKRGKFIWNQEFNSTYAMLKFYRGKPLATLYFTLLNTSWALSRIIILILKGRFKDGYRILSGCISAYRRFYT